MHSYCETVNLLIVEALTTSCGSAVVSWAGSAAMHPQTKELAGEDRCSELVIVSYPFVCHQGPAMRAWMRLPARLTINREALISCHTSGRPIPTSRAKTWALFLPFWWWSTASSSVVEVWVWQWTWWCDGRWWLNTVDSVAWCEHVTHYTIT
jgi:hypothetical protein